MLFTQVDIPASGDLLIFARNEPASASCTGTPCTLQMGIYLDDQPVPGSGLSYTDTNATAPSPMPSLFGRMPDVSAGQHNITVWYLSDGFLSVSGGDTPGSIGWVLLGG